MEVSRIIAEIDAQIPKLQQARALLAGTASSCTARPGRPKGSKNLLRQQRTTQTQVEPRRPKAHRRCDEEALGRAQEANGKG